MNTIINLLNTAAAIAFAFGEDLTELYEGAVLRDYPANKLPFCRVIGWDSGRAGYLTREAYGYQLMAADSGWTTGRGEGGWYDDDFSEEAQDAYYAALSLEADIITEERRMAQVEAERQEDWARYEQEARDGMSPERVQEVVAKLRNPLVLPAPKPRTIADIAKERVISEAEFMARWDAAWNDAEDAADNDEWLALPAPVITMATVRKIEDGMRACLDVVLSDGGMHKGLFAWYTDELRFSAHEFNGLTEAEAIALFHQRDIEYLRS